MGADLTFALVIRAAGIAQLTPQPIQGRLERSQGGLILVVEQLVQPCRHLLCSAVATTPFQGVPLALVDAQGVQQGASQGKGGRIERMTHGGHDVDRARDRLCSSMEPTVAPVLCQALERPAASTGSMAARARGST